MTRVRDLVELALDLVHIALAPSGRFAAASVARVLSGSWLTTTYTYLVLSLASISAALPDPVQPLQTFMDEDDIITPVLAHLTRARDFCAAACVSQQFRRLSELDLFWRPLCEQRWALFPDGPEYQTVADAAVADAASGASAKWRDEYVRRERLLVKDYPCFCMGSNLGIGEPIGLHFFEPGYRKLILMAMEGDRRFFFSAGQRATVERATVERAIERAIECARLAKVMERATVERATVLLLPNRGSLHYLCEAHTLDSTLSGRLCSVESVQYSARVDALCVRIKLSMFNATLHIMRNHVKLV